jgi:hypothetical protein
MSVTRTAAGSVNAVLGGTVSTPLGSLYVAGSLPASGSYTLESEAAGSLTVGDRTLTYATPAKLTKSGFEASGSLAYGDFSFTSTAKVSTSLVVSLSGSMTGSTQPKAFGLKVRVNQPPEPGHPYAWLAWNASASYDGPTQRIKASVSGNISVEYEVKNPDFSSSYPTKTLAFPALNLPAGGSITVSPGQTFKMLTPPPGVDPNVSKFDFDLP